MPYTQTYVTVFTTLREKRTLYTRNKNKSTPLWTWDQLPRLVSNSPACMIPLPQPLEQLELQICTTMLSTLQETLQILTEMSQALPITLTEPHTSSHIHRNSSLSKQ